MKICNVAAKENLPLAHPGLLITIRPFHHFAVFAGVSGSKLVGGCFDPRLCVAFSNQLYCRDLLSFVSATINLDDARRQYSHQLDHLRYRHVHDPFLLDEPSIQGTFDLASAAANLEGEAAIHLVSHPSLVVYFLPHMKKNNGMGRT